MASNNPSPPSSTTTLRILGLLKQPDGFDPAPLELDESDVVWSFFPSSDGSYSLSTSNSPSPPSLHHHPHRRFKPVQSGLSEALGDHQRHLVSRKSKAMRAATRPENVPAMFPQSAPVNIPVWPNKSRENRPNINDLNKFDEMEDDEAKEEDEGEMLPPHVIVARSHVTFYVFEGVGRTLKGRDLRRVRNAVFQKTVLDCKILNGAKNLCFEVILVYLSAVPIWKPGSLQELFSSVFLDSYAATLTLKGVNVTIIVHFSILVATWMMCSTNLRLKIWVCTRSVGCSRHNEVV